MKQRGERRIFFLLFFLLLHSRWNCVCASPVAWSMKLRVNKTESQQQYERERSRRAAMQPTKWSTREKNKIKKKKKRRIILCYKKNENNLIKTSKCCSWMDSYLSFSPCSLLLRFISLSFFFSVVFLLPWFSVLLSAECVHCAVGIVHWACCIVQSNAEAEKRILCVSRHISDAFCLCGSGAMHSLIHIMSDFLCRIDAETWGACIQMWRISSSSFSWQWRMHQAEIISINSSITYYKLVWMEFKR